MNDEDRQYLKIGTDKLCNEHIKKTRISGLGHGLLFFFLFVQTKFTVSAFFDSRSGNRKHTCNFFLFFSFFSA